jgi:hypothetical protein
VAGHRGGPRRAAHAEDRRQGSPPRRLIRTANRDAGDGATDGTIPDSRSSGRRDSNSGPLVLVHELRRVAANRETARLSRSGSTLQRHESGCKGGPVRTSVRARLA